MSIINSIWPDPQERVQAVCTAVQQQDAYNQCFNDQFNNANSIRTRTMIIGGVVLGSVIIYALYKHSESKSPT